jgi:hypothetical protein
MAGQIPPDPIRRKAEEPGFGLRRLATGRMQHPGCRFHGAAPTMPGGRSQHFDLAAVFGGISFCQNAGRGAETICIGFVPPNARIEPKDTRQFNCSD